MTDDNSRQAVQVEGTAYLYQVDGALQRAIRLQLPIAYSGPAQVLLQGDAGLIETTCTLSDGCGTLNLPPWERPLAISLSVSCPAGTFTGQAVLAPVRPWTIYVTQDKHLDFGWIHPVEQVVQRMNWMLDYNLDAARRDGLRWNLDASIWVEEYLKARPAAQAEQLLEALRAGRFELGALWLVPFPGMMSGEEILQNLSYARRLQGTYGIPVQTVSLQEVPSAPWGLATLLAGTGIRYVVKGAYDLRNPHLKERAPLALSWWEGPDDSRVLLKWDAYDNTHSWGGYAEAYALWRSSGNEERAKFIEATVARYEGYADYPFSAILLAGTGFDEYPQTTAVSDFIHWYNNQGWIYPKLVDATWSEFWQDVEAQHSAKGADVPIVRGDWGSTWEEWPAQLAHLNTIYRNARETLATAQSLSALAYCLDPASHGARREALAAAWRGLLQFADHNIGGITPEIADDMRDRKATYAYTARREASRALDSGLAVLAADVPAPAGDMSGLGVRRLLVANPSQWRRRGLVEILVPERGPYDVVDEETGGSLPCQIETRGRWPEHYLSLQVPDIPGFGYHTFVVRPGAASIDTTTAVPAELELENDVYHLAVNPQTGGLRSLWDKTAGRELVDAQDGYGLNQYVHFRDGHTYQAQVQSVKTHRGPVSSSLVVESICQAGSLKTSYVLYPGTRRLDILNELTREPEAEFQATWFLFPFNMLEHQYYYDRPAAILRPGLQANGGDLLPGSGRTCAAVQSFVAITRPDYYAVLATPDAHLVQFGKHLLGDPLDDLDSSQPLLLSTVMNNFSRNDFAVKQGGNEHFAFRYSLTAGQGIYQHSLAVRFAQEACRPLQATWVIGNSAADGSAQRSFLSISPDNVIATAFKVAEDERGWVLRLWECEGRATEAMIDASGLGTTQAWRCDLLEGDLETIPLDGGVMRLAIPARGMRAVRLL